jgi:hypothetical protein
MSSLGSGDVRGACRALRAATKLMPHDSDICKQFTRAVRPPAYKSAWLALHSFSLAHLPDEGGATPAKSGGPNVGELTLPGAMSWSTIQRGADLGPPTCHLGTLHNPGGEEAHIRALTA